MESALFNAFCELGVFGRRWQVSHRITAGLPLGSKDQLILARLQADIGIGSEGEYIGAGIQRLRTITDNLELSRKGTDLAEKLEEALIDALEADHVGRGSLLDRSRQLLVRLVSLECPQRAHEFASAVERQANEGGAKP